MIHNIKLREEFANAVFSGEKNFEVRWNNRGYQKGDEIRFRVVDKMGIRIEHELSGDGVAYEITYVLSGWGIKEGYVVFGIRRKQAVSAEDVPCDGCALQEENERLEKEREMLWKTVDRLEGRDHEGQ